MSNTYRIRHREARGGDANRKRYYADLQWKRRAHTATRPLKIGKTMLMDAQKQFEAEWLRDHVEGLTP